MEQRNSDALTTRSTGRSGKTISRLLPGLILLFFVTVVSAAGAPSRTVYVAGSGNTALDQHLTKLLQQRVGENTAVLPIAENELSSIKDAPVVAVGPSAFSKARQANRSAAILGMLVEEDLVSRFAERSPGQISAVYYNVPLLRQALTGKVILPHATKVSILANPTSAGLYEAVLDQLSGYGMQGRVFLVESSDDLIPTLIRALGYGDFLLAASDDAIYNPRTIKHILLTAYRRNRIVIGPSQAYVKAGSLASSYAPFPAMASLAADYINAYFNNGTLPPPAYPEQYRVEVNDQVARSLNIPLPDREEIAGLVNEKLAETGGPDNE